MGMTKQRETACYYGPFHVIRYSDCWIVQDRSKPTMYRLGETVSTHRSRERAHINANRLYNKLKREKKLTKQ